MEAESVFSLCVCLCVCACMGEIKKDREIKRQREESNKKEIIRIKCNSEFFTYAANVRNYYFFSCSSGPHTIALLPPAFW